MRAPLLIAAIPLLFGCYRVSVVAPTKTTVTLSSDPAPESVPAANQKTHVWLMSGLLPVTDVTTADIIPADCKRVSVSTEMTLTDGLVTFGLTFANYLFWGLIAANARDYSTASLASLGSAAVQLTAIPQLRTSKAYCTETRRDVALDFVESEPKPIKQPRRSKAKTAEDLPPAVAAASASAAVGVVSVESGCPTEKISIVRARPTDAGLLAIVAGCGNRYECEVAGATTCRLAESEGTTADRVLKQLAVETGCSSPESIRVLQRVESGNEELFRAMACERAYVCSVRDNAISCRAALVGYPAEAGSVDAGVPLDVPIQPPASEKRRKPLGQPY